MAKYVALLRGIAPMNPNMKNEKLRGVFEGLGFTNVVSVISSGNIIFETSRKDAAALEADIEQALHDELGIRSTTLIRSHEQLQRLVDSNPFAGHTHAASTYLITTFLQTKPPAMLRIPEAYGVVAVYDREVCCTVDNSGTKRMDPTLWLEKNYGKAITTRTWGTVERIIKKMAP